MKKLNWENILLAAIYLILGGVFLAHPEGVEGKLCYILSGSMAAMGLLYLIGHFFRKVDENGRREGYGFAIGVLLIILAVFVMEKQQLLLALVPFLFGVMVLVRGLIIFQNLSFFRKMGLGLPVPLISCILTVGLGLTVMLYPFEKTSVLYTFIGIGLVVGGIAGIIEEVLIHKAANKQGTAQ